MSVEKRINWYRNELDKETLRQLTRRSDKQGYIRILSLIAMVIATGELAYYAYLHWPLSQRVICMGSYFSLWVSSSRGMKYPITLYFKTRDLNTFFGRLNGESFCQESFHANAKSAKSLFFYGSKTASFLFKFMNK